MSTKWPTVRLAEVLTHNQEYIHVPEQRLYSKLSVKLYGKGVVLDTPAEGATLKMQRHQLAKRGQVILSEIWGKKGAIGLVPPEGEGALCTSHFFLFDVCGSRIEPPFLDVILKANYLEGQLNVGARGTTGYAAVRPSHLLSCQIPLPPLEEQRRLVARIEELAAQVSEAMALKAETKRQAERFWKVLSRMARDNKYPDKPLAEVVEFLDGQRIPLSEAERSNRKGPFPYYGASGVIDHVDQYLFDEPLLLLSEDGANLVSRSTPIAFMATGKYWVNNHAHVLRPHESVADLRFLAYSLSDYDVAVFNFASAQAKLNQKNAGRISLPLPPLSEQRRIVAELDALQAQVEALKRLQAESAAELDTLLPAILDRAFKGEL